VVEALGFAALGIVPAAFALLVLWAALLERRERRLRPVEPL
jgi:hypothetical protein